MFIEFKTEIGDATVEICCYLRHEEIETIEAYWKGRRWPKLDRWARQYLSTPAGDKAIEAAIEEAIEDARNDYPDRD